MSYDKNQFELAPPWLKDQNQPRKNSQQRNTAHPRSQISSQFNKNSTDSANIQPRAGSLLASPTKKRDNETAQFPPLAKPQSYTPSNSVWDNGNHTRVRIPSLPDKLGDESNNINKETSKHSQVRQKTIIQPLSSNDTQFRGLGNSFGNRRFSLQTPKPTPKNGPNVRPIRTFELDGQSNSSFKSLGTIKKTVKTIPSTSSEIDIYDMNSNGKVAFSDFQNRDIPQNEKEFLIDLDPNWENEKNEPLTEYEIKQWALKYPKEAKLKAERMRAKGLIDDDVVFAALETSLSSGST